jgi:hypothetical protein
MITRLKKIHTRRHIRKRKRSELHRVMDAATARSAEKRSQLRDLSRV